LLLDRCWPDLTTIASTAAGSFSRPRFGYTKAELMNVHKSTALIVAALIVPRVGLRLLTRLPKLPEGNKLEHLAGHASHFALYALMIGMPASGIAMGLNGKGLPFFGTTIPPLSNPSKEIAQQAFAAHKQAGQVLTYLVPVHIGAVGFHLAKGQNILKRIVPGF
jgi:cytochrome b561